MSLAYAALTALWALTPAYIPNNAAVLSGGGAPIDGGRTWRGERVLGDGKTWRGLAAGATSGVATALLLNVLNETLLTGQSLPSFSVAIAAALGLGAMLGDAAASFLKRRTGRERGAPFPVVDQLDFVAGALVLAAVVDLDWLVSLGWQGLLAVVLLTPLVHRGANMVAFRAGVKEEPW